jgi:hypothetical protein
MEGILAAVWPGCNREVISIQFGFVVIVMKKLGLP